MPSEFALIRRHFTRPARHTDLAVGDDAALIRPAPGMQLAISTDMLVAGTHFFADTDPEGLGWKTLAVNVSDIAAMGAQPRWVVLAASLPGADEAWIEAFARGFFSCCEAFGIDAIGGDTTRGPLNLCPTIFGEVPFGQAITRSGARPGDDLWVSGTPGRAALGLAHLQDRTTLAAPCLDDCLAALHRPQPRVALGLALRSIASAMLDVSDGLLGDLDHILELSGVGAEIDHASLPLAPLVAACGDAGLAFRACTAGGDDYELLFSAPPDRRDELLALQDSLQLPLHRIGRLTADIRQVSLRYPDGHLEKLAASGYDHFGRDA
ncbi:thiamine-phosphate kinase [Zoogloea dura]|jgi:thiamine-monophosphate kinase|uniref:Thiamine-monophosphate kinase n=1 Tax=Zoogloea dura TaxID=2728840 RepID=A0A848G5Q5_9RHOO|nr:thiamine-phosphate kinase [Zoogloea dura]NML26275.1 thiamine-phosphate kinase [Zoogloea dura]